MERHVLIVVQLLLVVGGVVSAPQKRALEKIVVDNGMPPNEEPEPQVIYPEGERGLDATDKRGGLMKTKRGGDMKVLREVMERANAEKRIPYDKSNNMDMRNLVDDEIMKNREVNMGSDMRRERTEQEKRRDENARALTNERNEMKDARSNAEKRGDKDGMMIGKRATSQMTKSEIQEALNDHRKYRAQEDASNMWSIEWSVDLANLAQELADTCVFKHDKLKLNSTTHVGQNLGAMTGQHSSISLILGLFYDEKKDYDFITNSWDPNKMVGHYLQMSNWQTTLVGCGKKVCDKLEVVPTGEFWTDATYYVCDYWPPVSWKEPPYEKGEHCSMCIMPESPGMGFQCKDDGCDECRLDDANQNCHPPIECPRYTPDTYVYQNTCKTIEKWGACNKDDRNHAFAKINCQTTCKVCADVPQRFHSQ
uniref:SCP domain-containing protein n=1 Tax=Pinctada fucata TaxID=50426 RepID=A0A194AJ68_PINFU